MSDLQDVPGTAVPHRDTLLQSLLTMASFHGIAADSAPMSLFPRDAKKSCSSLKPTLTYR
jgi:hypothetical protein